jgi:hypothetical protein
MKHMSFFAMLWLLSSGVLASEQALTLPITCHAIPNHADALCVVATYSADNPVNDVVFYRRDEFGSFVFLEAMKGDVGHVFVSGFSKGGKYTMIVYAEEGHPSFIIYATATFLSSFRPITSVALVSHYSITRILSLDDKGNVIIELRDSPADIQSEQSCLPAEQLPEYSDTDRCHITYSIFQERPEVKMDTQ